MSSEATTDVPRHAVLGTVIEALGPGESWPVLTVHEALSPASRRLRYSAPTARLTPRMVRVLTDLRPGQHEAYAAWRTGRPIGIVRWIRTPGFPLEAELALEVVDAEQGHGVGRALAVRAAAGAWRAGVRTFVVSVDPQNHRVHAWLTALGSRALPDDADRFVVPVHAVRIAEPAPTTAFDMGIRRPGGVVASRRVQARTLVGALTRVH